MEDDKVMEEAMRVFASAKWTDWLLRSDGSWTRLIQFPEAISESVREHIVLAIVLCDGPTSQPVAPDEHSDSLSSDRRLLHLRVTPPPASHQCRPNCHSVWV